MTGKLQQLVQPDTQDNQAKPAILVMCELVLPA
jgi:hypothetical protein